MKLKKLHLICLSCRNTSAQHSADRTDENRISCGRAGRRDKRVQSEIVVSHGGDSWAFEIKACENGNEIQEVCDEVGCVH